MTAGGMMGTATLTTKDVARLLHVSEATVKRWADDGRLFPEKTAGGHRRFSIQSVARLRREYGISPDAPVQTRAMKKTSSAHRLLTVENFTNLLLRADETEVAAELVAAYLQSHALASVFDKTITQAMHRVGELWFNGSITVADEHLATRVMLTALQKLRAVIVQSESIGRKAICCAVEGDLHELPVHLAEILLEAAGWDTLNLGANTPIFALREMVVQKKPHLVCISARSIADLDRATNEYAQLRKVTEKLNTLVVLGGEAFRDRKLRERFPASFYAETFAELSKFLITLSK